MHTFTKVGLGRLGAVAPILFDHAGASGTVLAWELANEAQRA
jgi:hypothetical protein